MRPEVAALVALGPLPSEDVDAEVIQRHQDALEAIARPVSDEEARAVVDLFGPDECYELAWVLLHLIETAPGWPLTECLRPGTNEWVDRLIASARRANLM